MSIKIMAAIFESEVLCATERLIMLSLADHSDDNGRCYPSIARLCQRTGLKERAVQTNIRKLVASGYISIIANGGPGGVNLFFVRATPAPDAPPQEMHPAPDAPPPRISCAKPPQEMHPEPSGTIIEPSNDNNNDADAAGEFSDTAFEVPFDFEDEGTQHLAIPLSDYRSCILEAIGIEPGTSSALGGPADMAEACRWLTLPHVTEDRVCDKIRAVMMRKGARRPHSLAYFTEEMRRMSVDIEEAMKPLLPIEPRPAYVYRLHSAQPPKAPPAVDLDALAESWVEPVKAGRAYAGSSIKPAVARHMLDRGLVTEIELRRVGVAL